MKYEAIKNEKTSLMIKFIKDDVNENPSLYIRNVFNELKEDGRDIDKFRWFGDLEKDSEAILDIVFE